MKLSSSPAGHIKLTIAGLNFHLQCPDLELLAQLAERYAGFLGQLDRSGDHWQEADFVADIKVAGRSGGLKDLSGNLSFGDGLIRFDGQDVEGWIDGVKGKGELIFSSQYGFEVTDYFLRVALAAAAFRSGGLMLHAAGIVHQEKAYLFLGHSGSGKSTVARLSGDDRVLNDDLVVLMPDQRSWQVYATPFWNPSQVRPGFGQARLAGIFRLVQDKQVYIEPMKTGLAIAELIANIPVLSADPAYSLGLLVRAQMLAQIYRVVQLHFLPDASFWQVIEAGAYQFSKDR